MPDDAQMPPMRAVVDHLLGVGDVLGVGLTIVVLAFIVNRYAPQRRRHIARVVTLFVLHLVAFALYTAAESAGQAEWAARFDIVHELLEAITIVSVVALAVFDVALPLFGIELVTIVADVIVGIAYAGTTLVVLRRAGLDVTSFVAVSTVAAGVLTFSMQSTLSNVLGGVAIHLDGSVKPGDWVELPDKRQGRVKEIRWRHTVIETRDWDTLIVPNASLMTGQFAILGKRQGQPLQRRMWVQFNVDHTHAPSRVIEVVESALRQAPIPRVAQTPPPDCICVDLARDHRDSFAVYAVRYWLTDLAADDPANSAIRTRVWSALRRAGIPLARPESTLYLTRKSADDASEIERKRQLGIATLRQLALFQPLNDDELAELADQLVPAPFLAGETVTRQGAVAHWLYVLRSGTVEIRYKASDGAERHVATLQAPAYFGEMGLMTGEPRWASVVATSEVECFRLDKAAFHAVLERRPQVAESFSRTLAERRTGLLAAQGLEVSAAVREQHDQERILGRIREFFGLDR
jgi:small-conductance mechanosensitive channel/CRP-like cAMP-binding protein